MLSVEKINEIIGNMDEITSSMKDVTELQHTIEQIGSILENDSTQRYKQIESAVDELKFTQNQLAQLQMNNNELIDNIQNKFKSIDNKLLTDFAEINKSYKEISDKFQVSFNNALNKIDSQGILLNNKTDNILSEVKTRMVMNYDQITQELNKFDSKYQYLLSTTSNELFNNAKGISEFCENYLTQLKESLSNFRTEVDAIDIKLQTLLNGIEYNLKENSSLIKTNLNFIAEKIQKDISDNQDTITTSLTHFNDSIEETIGTAKNSIEASSKELVDFQNDCSIKIIEMQEQSANRIVTNQNEEFEKLITTQVEAQEKLISQQEKSVKDFIISLSEYSDKNIRTYENLKQYINDFDRKYQSAISDFAKVVDANASYVAKLSESSIVVNEKMFKDNRDFINAKILINQTLFEQNSKLINEKFQAFTEQNNKLTEHIDTLEVLLSKNKKEYEQLLNDEITGIKRKIDKVTLINSFEIPANKYNFISKIILAAGVLVNTAILIYLLIK